MKYLLDTNVLKEVGKPVPHRNVAAWLDTVDDVDLALSVISVRENAKGIEKKRAKDPDLATRLQDAVDGIYSAFDGRILDVGFEVARRWGILLGRSEKNIEDAGLAATAVVQGLTVVTRNVTDFQERGVEVLNPFKKLAKPAKSPAPARSGAA